MLLIPSKLLLFFCEMVVGGHHFSKEKTEGGGIIGADVACDCVCEFGSSMDTFSAVNCFGELLLLM